MILTLPDEKASERFAVQLAKSLPKAATITLAGEIGSGKTTIIRAILKQLGVRTPIKSPSFSLVESYQCQEHVIHHFDLYRIQYEDELEYIGFRDYFRDEGFCFIEWPEHGGGLLPHIDMKLCLTFNGTGRTMQIYALTALGKQILSCLMSKS